MTAALHRLIDAPPFHIDAAGQGAGLVLSFASVGHDPGRLPSPEFVGSALGTGGRRALFIADASRSWAGHPGFAPALRAGIAAAGAPPGRVLAMGLSMGGFAALAAARVLAVDAVLAFGPQFAPAGWPDLPDPRWARWTDALSPDHPWPEAPLTPGVWTILMHGLADDRAQAMAFPVLPGVDHLLFPDLTHSALVPHLKSRGALAGLVEATLSGDRRRLIRIATSAGAVRRR